MKKRVLLALGVVLVLAASLLALSATLSDSKSANKESNSSNNDGRQQRSQQTSTDAARTDDKSLAACVLLTLEDAQSSIGATAQISSTNSDDSEKDTGSTTCTYRTPIKKVGDAPDVASLIVRSPKTDSGRAANKAQFVTLPLGAESVPNIGDTAYWQATTGQLNVLRNDTWYTLTAGSAGAGDRSQQQAVLLASKIFQKL